MQSSAVHHVAFKEEGARGTDMVKALTDITLFLIQKPHFCFQYYTRILKKKLSKTNSKGNKIYSKLHFSKKGASVLSSVQGNILGCGRKI